MMLKDKRYWYFFFFTGFSIALLLFIEDTIEYKFKVSEAMLLEFVIDIFLFSIFAFLLSLVIQQIIAMLNDKLPWDTMLSKRLFIEIALILIMVVSLTFVTSLAYDFYSEFQDEVDDDLSFEFLVMTMLFMSIFMLFSFHEFIFLSGDKTNLKLTNALLQKQNYISKYEALRNQINPHFLFNSLNVLSSLIYLDPVKADTFIKKFSEVFRYVLELNQEKLVTVKRELTFLDSYLYLQKIRFGDNLIINKQLNSEILETSIPPLTFQLVIENAIKHNVITDRYKLIIWITNNEDEITIANTYQYRDVSSDSTGIGHKNLLEKYSLICSKKPYFRIKDSRYLVSLPVIKALQWTEL
ncbi:MAG: histidine kinase [Bacteroidota bacterium]